MNDMQAKVTEFHFATGSPLARRPELLALERNQLRVQLIREEFEELQVSMLRKDLVECADALADLLYVVLGTAVEMGIDMNPVFNEVHRANMSKCDENGQFFKRDDGKVLKSKGYTPPDIKGVLQEQHLSDDFDAATGEILSRCTKAPARWICIRQQGHTGPCSAYPV